MLACDTICPPVPERASRVRAGNTVLREYWLRSASDMGAAELIERDVSLEAGRGDQQRLALALTVLEHPAVCLLSTGSVVPFSRRSAAERERMLRALRVSRIPQLRGAFQVIKRLAGYAFFAAPGPEGTNVNETALGYPTPWRPPARPAMPANPANPIAPLWVTEATTLEADVCVVGSGAGGGVVAALLAQAGRRVVVLEAGDNVTEEQFDGHEDSGFQRHYARRGLLASYDLGIAVLAGRGLGGGTTINWMTCFRPPDRLLRQWAEASGVPGLTGPELQASLDAVEQRLHVDKDESYMNGPNSLLMKGAEALGWHHEVQARNAKGCGDCGLCSFGCPWGAKQDTRRTYLQDAYDVGAQVVTRASAYRVLLEGNRAVGVEAWVRPPGPWRGSGDSPDGVALTVRAPMVVVAAGGVESPALLLRSGLRHAALGRNLYLHPATSVAGVFDSEVAAWSGPLQSAHSDQFANLNGEGYGFKFETTPLYPGLAATALPWVSGADFKARMLNLKNVLSLLVLCRDRVGGRVRLDRQGNARIDYVVSRYDREHMLRGVREGARLTLAAGARDVYTLHSRLTSIGRKERNNPLAWQRFDSRVERLGAASNSMMVFSAHQMGTCRMSADSGRGVVDGNGAVHGYRGLYVADGSVFPLSSGVNPMITIMGMAHWIGTRLAEG